MCQIKVWWKYCLNLLKTIWQSFKFRKHCWHLWFKKHHFISLSPNCQIKIAYVWTGPDSFKFPLFFADAPMFQLKCLKWGMVSKLFYRLCAFMIEPVNFVSRSHSQCPNCKNLDQSLDSNQISVDQFRGSFDLADIKLECIGVTETRQLADYAMKETEDFNSEELKNPKLIVKKTG